MHTGHRCGGGGCLRGALPSLAMLTRWLGCLSTLATNEIDPGALAHTEVAPFTQQGLSINQAGAKYQSCCTKKKKLYIVNVLLSEWIPIESPVDFVKRSSFSKCVCMWVCVHMLTLLCTVCAVPEPALLLVSGVLECWKHLAGRFNIQLTGSQTSYITAENPPPPPPTPPADSPSSLYPGLFPIHCPSLWSDLSIPLHSLLFSVLCCPQSLF